MGLVISLRTQGSLAVLLESDGARVFLPSERFKKLIWAWGLEMGAGERATVLVSKNLVYQICTLH